MKILFSLALSLALHVTALTLWANVRVSSPVGRLALSALLPLNARLIRDTEPQLRPATEKPSTSGAIQHETLADRTTPSTTNSQQPSAAHKHIGPIAFLPPSSSIDIYYPRTQLTRQPHLAKNVDLSPVASFETRPPASLMVELYINEQGRVDRVDSQPNDLSHAAAEKLQELLLQLSFSAGEIEGTPVKARLKIEVLFLPNIPDKNTQE